LKTIGNLSAIKRIAWLSEVLDLDGFNRFRENAKKALNEKYSLFDPFGSEQGKYLSEWKLRLNVSEEDILDITETSY
jgi:predicted transcriptional regulator of viral defense system